MQQKRTFIREWRKHRGLTLEELGAKVGLTHGQLSKVERGLRPYKQETLEAIADVLETTPASLLERDPGDPEGIWDVWQSVPSAERPRALEMLRVFSRR